MELPLTFKVSVYHTALSEVQGTHKSRLLDEADIRQFLGSTLRMGFLFYRHPEINLDACDNDRYDMGFKQGRFYSIAKMYEELGETKLAAKWKSWAWFDPYD